MSNRQPDARDDSLPKAIQFNIAQALKNVHTCYPGIVREYNPTTKRARVQPGLRLTFTDGAQPVEKQPIINVPLRQTATGGHMMHHQIDEGDVVLLVFSERGLSKWKENWGEISDPQVESFFREQDALAIPWGVENIPPVRSTGWLIQNESGTCYLSLDQDTIRVYTDQTSIVIQPNRVDTVAPETVTITVGGATFTMTPSQIEAQLGSSRLTITNGNCELRAAGTLTLRGSANTVVL